MLVVVVVDQIIQVALVVQEVVDQVVDLEQTELQEQQILEVVVVDQVIVVQHKQVVQAALE